MGGINFDSVIIGDFEESLKSVATSLLYTDISSKRITYIALNQWFDASLLKACGIKPYEKIKDLSIAQRHIVQISRSLVHDADIVIMDEPTASLSQKEIDELYVIIRNLKKQNKSIIFISHKLDEVLEICDEFTVLRDGELIKTDLISNTNKGEFMIEVLPLNPIMTITIIVTTPNMYEPQAFTYALTFSLRPAYITSTLT